MAAERKPLTTGEADLDDHLRATAETIVQDAEHIAALERAKVDLSPTNPTLQGISDAVERLVEKMRKESAAERALVDELAKEPRGAVQ